LRALSLLNIPSPATLFRVFLRLETTTTRKTDEQIGRWENIYVGGTIRTMATPSADSIMQATFPRTIFPPGERIATGAAENSPLEREVIWLFEQHRNSILRYTLSFGITVHDGEEVTQEVFLALFRHLQMGKSRRNLRGWIFRVAHNLALKQREANSCRHGARETDWSLAERQADPSPNPEEHASAAQRRRKLLSIFDALPEEDRWCLRLRAEGLKYREIAQVVGISLGGVSVSLTRSIRRMIRADGE